MAMFCLVTWQELSMQSEMELRAAKQTRQQVSCMLFDLPGDEASHVIFSGPLSQSRCAILVIVFETNFLV